MPSYLRISIISIIFKGQSQQETIFAYLIWFYSFSHTMHHNFQLFNRCHLGNGQTQHTVMTTQKKDKSNSK